MHGSKKVLAKMMDTKAFVIREVEWGDMHIGIETYNEKVDLTTLLKGLPDDRCQSRHWGYMVKGSMVVKYKDREEVVSAGDAYYLEPGHMVIMEAGSELVEFSPKDEYKKTQEAVERNLAKMKK